MTTPEEDLLRQLGAMRGNGLLNLDQLHQLRTYLSKDRALARKFHARLFRLLASAAWNHVDGQDFEDAPAQASMRKNGCVMRTFYLMPYQVWFPLTGKPTLISRRYIRPRFLHHFHNSSSSSGTLTWFEVEMADLQRSTADKWITPWSTELGPKTQTGALLRPSQEEQNDQAYTVPPLLDPQGNLKPFYQEVVVTVEGERIGSDLPGGAYEKEM